MSLDFTAIDFETAAPARASVCAVAAVKVRDGIVVEQVSTLVRPPTGLEDFRNSWVHGITADQVMESPTWPEIFPDLMAFFGSDIIVAHNAAFDRSVLRGASAACGLDASGTDFVCTLRMSRSLLDLGSYTLPVVSRELGLPAFEHHEAGADALAAAQIAIALAARSGATSVQHLVAAADLLRA